MSLSDDKQGKHTQTLPPMKASESAAATAEKSSLSGNAFAAAQSPLSTSFHKTLHWPKTAIKVLVGVFQFKLAPMQFQADTPLLVNLLSVYTVAHP